MREIFRRIHPNNPTTTTVLAYLYLIYPHSTWFEFDMGSITYVSKPKVSKRRGHGGLRGDA